MAVEHAAARTREVSITAQTVIEPDSPLGAALQDLGTTNYFFEMDLRSLRPGEKASKTRFLATLRVNGCITVFVSSPDGRALAVHMTGAYVMISVRQGRGAVVSKEGTGLDRLETFDGSRWGVSLNQYSQKMQDLFRGVDPSQVTISLVGGWRKHDRVMAEELQFHFPGEEALWCFSGVVRTWAAEALPGAVVDVELLNRFEGLEVGPSDPKDAKRCLLQGQYFGVVALDTHTGKIVTHTKYFDRPQHKLGPVPQSVLDDNARHTVKNRGEIRTFDPNYDAWVP